MILWMTSRRRANMRDGANFGLVMHAAQSYPHKLASSARAMDLPKDVLPTPGGPQSKG
jgi:hypothetical protein